MAKGDCWLDGDGALYRRRRGGQSNDHEGPRDRTKCKGIVRVCLAEENTEQSRQRNTSGDPGMSTM
jgi:hypothetical protein